MTVDRPGLSSALGSESTAAEDPHSLDVSRVAAHMACLSKWRRASWLYQHGFWRSARWLELAIRRMYGADLPASLALPPDIVLMHNALGVVIHQETTFLGPAMIFQHVTIGESPNRDGGRGVPTIGRFVTIGSGAVVLGGVTIGDYAVIGANAVVRRDVPAGHRLVNGTQVVEPIDRARALALFPLARS